MRHRQTRPEAIIRALYTVSGPSPSLAGPDVQSVLGPVQYLVNTWALGGTSFFAEKWFSIQG